MAAILELTEGAAPSTPGSGLHNLYFDTSGDPHILKDDGTNKTLAYTDISCATANIADAAVTNVKLADMAQDTIKGRASGAGTGDATDLTAAQAAAILAAHFPAIGDAAWTAFTVGASWATTSLTYPSALEGYNPTWTACGYRKVGGIVHLRGTVRCTSNTDVAVATLPTDYRPAVDMWFPCLVSTTSTLYNSTWLLIKTTGELIAVTNTGNYFHFDGICFPV